MQDDDAAIRTLIGTYYRAFQGNNAAAIAEHVQFPYTFWATGEMTALANEADFARWWTSYLNKVKTETGFVRGEVLNLSIEHLSDTAALVKMRSSRLGAHDRLIAEVVTAFLTYRTKVGWRIGGLIANVYG